MGTEPSGCTLPTESETGAFERGARNSGDDSSCWFVNNTLDELPSVMLNRQSEPLAAQPTFGSVKFQGVQDVVG